MPRDRLTPTILFYLRGQQRRGRVFASPRPPLLPLNLSSAKCICMYSMWTCCFVNPKPRKEAAPNRCLHCCFLSVTAAVKAPSLCQTNTASKVLCGFFCVYIWVSRSLGAGYWPGNWDIALFLKDNVATSIFLAHVLHSLSNYGWDLIKIWAIFCLGFWQK